MAIIFSLIVSLHLGVFLRDYMPLTPCYACFLPVSAMKSFFCKQMFAFSLYFFVLNAFFAKKHSFGHVSLRFTYYYNPYFALFQVKRPQLAQKAFKTYAFSVIATLFCQNYLCSHAGAQKPGIQTPLFAHLLWFARHRHTNFAFSVQSHHFSHRFTKAVYLVL